MIAQGASPMTDPYVNPRVYDRSLNGGFIKDNNNLSADVQSVGKDMAKQ